MGGREKFKKERFFSLRNFVFLSIILTCIVAMGKFSQDIFLTIQEPVYIEVTREIQVGIVVTATPSPINAIPSPTYPYGQTPCNRDMLLQAIEANSNALSPIRFDCNNVILINEPIVIDHTVHLIGSSELLTSLSQGQDIASLFIIESGGNLTLENIAIRDIRGTVLDIRHGGVFAGRNCRITGSGHSELPYPLIRNDGSLSFSQCVIEDNRIASGTMVWMGGQSTTNLESTIFRANYLETGHFTGEASLLENNGGVLRIHISYFVDNVGNNTKNWIIRSRSGETNIGRSLFRNNVFSMQGYMVENEISSMMYMDAVSMYGNTIARGEYITNAGNLRIMYAGLFSGRCINTGILNDIAEQCP